MHKDLEEVIASSKLARDGVMNKTLSVKDANSIASQNNNVISAHALDLRTNIYLAESESRIPGLPAPKDGDEQRQ